MADNNTEEKRRFSRIAFDAAARLQCGERSWPTALLDISLKGALVSRPADWDGAKGERCGVELVLDQAQAAIVMEGSVAHVSDDRIGVRCDQLDLDSASHLKRLVQLNLGDDSLLERELKDFIDGP